VQEYLRTRHLTGLLLLLSESLVVMLIIFRRPAMQVDRSTRARVVTAVSLAGPPLLRTGGVPLLPDMATAAISVVGVALALASKMSIGRSFGLVPANRGMVDRGPYALVRHPIYAGYLISHVGFLCAHPTVMNAALLVVADAALVYRALLEERTLAGDPRYRTYMQRVAWHLVPGVF
jgi:protein-S-isoprenylcysteine O-methyltransferase Ste14